MSEIFYILDNGVRREATPEEAAQIIADRTAVIVPETVRSAQLRQWLIDNDLFDAVTALLNNEQAWPNAKTRLKAIQRWEHEINYKRSDQLVTQLGAALGMTEIEIDTAFIEADRIP